MAYKIKSKSKKIPASYWEQREMAEIRKKYKGKLPPFSVITREGTRKIEGIQPRTHKKGNYVEYKEGIAKVKKVTKRGLWLEPFNKPTEKSIAYPSGKIVFIPEKRVEKEVYPLFLNMPVVFASIPTMIKN